MFDALAAIERIIGSGFELRITFNDLDFRYSVHLMTGGDTIHSGTGNSMQMLLEECIENVTEYVKSEAPF